MISQRHQIRFVASLTVDASSIRRIIERLDHAQTRHNPLAHVLTTPIFAGNKALAAIRDIKERGSSVMFDSGGYYCQTGRIDYQSLYSRLLRIYGQNQWADMYVLPDNVPTSKDDPETVAQKVCMTYEQSSNFFQAMPDELKPRAMPVVHGHNYQQIDACLETYIRLGVKQIGFGSFGTFGKNSQVNVATQSAVEYARYTAQVAHSYGIKVHMFGMGVPVVIMMLYGIQADSFDSSSWLKAAGFGQVFLPLMRAYNITHRNTTSELQKGINVPDFRLYCQVTGHSCPLCDCMDCLQYNKMQRAAHNLIVLCETVEMLNSGKLERTPDIYRYTSQRYQKEFDRWLPSN
jgi:hypothetical protein